MAVWVTYLGFTRRVLSPKFCYPNVQGVLGDLLDCFALWFKPLDHSFFIFPFCTTTHPAHAHFSCILALQGHQKRAPFVHSFSTRVELCYSLKTLCCGSISSIACELIYLTTNGLLCAYFPLSGGHREGTIDTQREHS